VANYPAPEGLGERSLELWTKITEEHILRVDELYVLEAACREIDLIDRMETHQKDASLIGTGSQGQPVAAPLIAELRQHRKTFTDFMRQLHLPDVDGRAAQSTSDKARMAANVRWGNAG